MADALQYMNEGTLVKNNQVNKTEETDHVEKEVSEEKIIQNNCCNGILSEKLEDKMRGEEKGKEEKKDDSSKTMEDRLKDKSVGTGSAFVSSYRMYFNNFGVLNITS